MALILPLVAFQIVVVIIINSVKGGTRNRGADEGTAADLDNEIQKGKAAADKITILVKGKEPQGSAADEAADQQGKGAADASGQAPSTECPEVCLCLPGSAMLAQRQVLRRSWRGSSGGSEGSVVKDNEASLLGKGAAERAPEAGTINGVGEEHQTPCNQEGESLTSCILQNQNHQIQNLDHLRNHSHVQVFEPHLGTTVGHEPAWEERENRIRSQMDGRNEDGEPARADVEAEEERKQASKFSYFAAGISAAGIISIFSGYLGNQSGKSNSLHLKICTFFVLATFISAASMVLLIVLYPSIRVSVQIFKTLKYTTLVCLSLAALYVSYLFLKVFAVLAFVPTIIVLLIAFILGLCQNGFQRNHHRVNGTISRSFSRLSRVV